MMDGVATMDTGNNAALLQLNIEAIAEVKVLTSDYQAEYGRASGLQITAVTKSGTNQFRGSVYEVRRDSDWNSNSWANKQNNQAKTVSKQDDFGLLDRRPGRQARRRQQAVLLLQPGMAAAQGRRPGATSSASRRALNAPAISRDARQQRHPLPVHPRRVNGPACAATDTPRLLARTAAWSARFPPDRLYQIGLNILKQYPMPNLPRSAPASTTTTRDRRRSSAT